MPAAKAPTHFPSPPLRCRPTQPTNILAQANGNTLQLTWPQDHLGWRLQVQTNSLTDNNWVTVPNSTNFNTAIIDVDPANGSVYFRFVYP